MRIKSDREVPELSESSFAYQINKINGPTERGAVRSDKRSPTALLHGGV